MTNFFAIPAFIIKYQTAPLAEPRARYLHHLKGLGTCRTTLRKSANDQLSLVLLLDLREGDRVSIPRIEAAAAIWSQPKGRRCNRAASPKARKRFVSCGIQWLRFLGWLDEPEEYRHLYHAEVETFEGSLRTDRGLSDATVQSYRVGLRREDVLRLLASVQEDRPVDKRDRAILMLFIAYGLRAGEVGGLRLDDFDWENGMVRVRCPKPGRTHFWPLSQGLGHAILR
ncbi:Phage integrase family protein [Rhizobiales bacterium GAS191]|nr:Phage integrase family protein [Rhizobiales bacterium GAS191]